VWRDVNLSLPEIPPKEQRYFSPDEMRAIVKAEKGQWRVMFATLACSGVRCGEVFALHVEDLDLANSRIFVRRGIWNGEEVSVKTKRGFRVVTIEPALVHVGATSRRTYYGASVPDSQRDTVLQVECPAQAQSDSQVSEAGTGRFARVPSWSRVGAAGKRRTGGFGQRVGRSLQPADHLFIYAFPRRLQDTGRAGNGAIFTI